MLASEHYDHLLSFLVLHYHHSILKVKVHKDVLWRGDAVGQEGLLLELFSFNIGKHVQMLLIELGQLHFTEYAA